MIAILRIESRCCTVSSYHVPRGAPRSAAVLLARLRRSALGSGAPRDVVAGAAERLGVGASVSVTLDLVAGEPPIEVQEAVVQSTRDDAIGVQFVRLQPGERRRLQRVVVDLYPRSHDATVPPAPDLPDERKLRILYSVDFWLVALAVVLVLVAWLRLFPWSG